MTVLYTRTGYRECPGKVQSLLTALGVRPERSPVVLKPNVLSAYRPEHAVTTHPAVVEGAIRYFRDLGSTVVIGESSVIGTRTPEALKMAGIEEIARRYGVEVIDFDEAPRVDVEWARGKISLPAVIVEGDLVNLAKMKTHVQTTVTLCHKNLKGLLDSATKKRFHRDWGLHEPIKDLALVVRPLANIVDGVTAIEGNGPGRAGNVVRPGLVMAGTDMREVDSACLLAMGIDGGGILHFDALPSGGFSLHSIDYPEEVPVFPIHPFAMPTCANRRLNTRFWMGNACSGCVNNLYEALRRLRYRPFKLLRFMAGNFFGGYDFILGRNHADLPARGICIGNCSAPCPGRCDGYPLVRGCPPSIDEILEIL